MNLIHDKEIQFSDYLSDILFLKHFFKKKITAHWDKIFE